MVFRESQWSIHPERDETLRRMWDEKASASTIAGALGITRNAVIGRVHRLGLASRKKSPIDVARAPRPPKPQMPREEAAGIASNLKRIRIGGGYAQPTAPIAAEPLPAEIIEAPNAHNCTLLELTNITCRWPIGDPGTAEFRFCGDPSADLENHRPYCAYHSRVARAPSRGLPFTPRPPSAPKAPRSLAQIMGLDQ